MRNPEIAIGQNSRIRRGTFQVQRPSEILKKGQQAGKTELLYHAKGCLADDWAAMGVTDREINQGNDVLLVRHPDDRFVVDPDYDKKD